MKLCIGTGVWVAAAGLVLASTPRIEFIERYGTDRLTIHLNTDANRTYVLQYSRTLTSGSWSNLVTIPAEPFPNHYVLVAPATDLFGFFRIEATP